MEFEIELSENDETKTAAAHQATKQAQKNTKNSI